MLYLDSNFTHPYNVTGATALLFNTSAMVHHAHHHQLPPSIYRCPTDSAPPKSCYKDEWADPSAVPLPSFKSMKIWCTYGIGIPTEVGYHYSTSEDDLTANSAFSIDTSLNKADALKNGIILKRMNILIRTVIKELTILKNGYHKRKGARV